MKRHAGLDFADLMVGQYGHEALQVALEAVRQVHIRLSRQTARMREVSPEDKTDQQRIIEAVCAHFGILQREFRNRHRSKRLSYARRICWALLVDRLSMSQREVGDLFDRDNSTVSIGIDRPDARGDDYAAITRRLDTDLVVANDVRLPTGPALELEAAE